MAEKRWKSRKTVKFSDGDVLAHDDEKHIKRGLSPAQWFCGYRQRTAAPAAPYAYKRVSDDKLVLHADRGEKVRQNKKRHHDQWAVELEQLEIGDQVVIQNPKTSM